MKNYFIYLLVILLSACSNLNNEKTKKKEIEIAIQENLNKTISETFLKLKLGMNKEEVLKQLYSISKDENLKIEFNNSVDYFTNKGYDFIPYYKLDSTISFNTSFFLEKDSTTIREYNLHCNLQFYENMLYSIHLSAFLSVEEDSSLFYNYFQKNYGIGHIDSCEYLHLSNRSSWVERSIFYRSSASIITDDNLNHYLKQWIFNNIEVFIINTIMEKKEYIVDKEYAELVENIVSNRGFDRYGNEYQKYILKEFENSPSMKFVEKSNISKINIIYFDRKIHKKIYDDIEIQRKKIFLKVTKDQKNNELRIVLSMKLKNKN